MCLFECLTADGIKIIQSPSRRLPKMVALRIDVKCAIECILGGTLHLCGVTGCHTRYLHLKVCDVYGCNAAGE